MKVAIIGSRSLENFDKNKIIENLPKNCTEIVSGGAKGIDTLAREIAKSLKIKFTCFLPNYQKFAKSAPIKRNDTILLYSDFVLAIWDIHSKGTMYMIQKCIEQKKPFKILSDNI